MRVKSKQILLILALLFLLGIAQSQNDQDDEENKPNNDDQLPVGSNPEKNDDDEEEENDSGEINETPVEGNPDDATEIKIGEYYKINKKIAFNNGYQPAGYFYFNVTEKIEKKDIFIMVRGREDFTHNPALFYSMTNKHPDLSQEDDISCGLTGHDFCVIKSDQIKKGQTYYFGVQCIKSCKFDIFVQYDKVFEQRLNDQAIYESTKDTPYLLEIQINLPKDLSPSIEHILIESYILNFNEVQSNFHMYVNKGTTPPTPSSYQYITEELKLNGQSILLEREIDKFDSSTVYTLAIEIPPKARILVRSESFEKQRTIFFYKSVDDMVRKGQIRIFKLEVSPFTTFEWDKEELSIDLEPYFGNPDLYISHGQLPEDPTNLASYRWSSTEQGGLESLTITKGSINNKSLVGEIFYIVVFGESAASFRLLTYSSSLEQRQLLFNCVENGYTVQNDIVSYQFYIGDEESSDISVKLTTLQGDTQLFIKRCMNISKIEECQVTLQDTKNNELKEPNFMKSIEQSKNHRIMFHYNKSECFNSNQLNICTFVVGILGTSKSESKYRLLAKHTIQPIQLRENEDHRSFMLEGEKEYYKFTINIEDPTITKVEFSINSISGEIAAFSSRNNTLPDQNDHDREELGQQDLITYSKTSKKPSLKGTYYVGIQAISGCIYSIYVKVYRQDNKIISSNMKALELGNVEKGYLSYQVPHQYYFTINPKEITPTHQTNIVLYFNTYKNETVPNIRLYPNIQIAYHYNKTIQQVTRFQEDYLSSDFIFIKIFSNFTENGKYVISLQHKDSVMADYQIKYQLNVNAHNIIYIVPRGAYIQDLSTTDLDNYELYLNEPAKVYLEVFECFGKVKIQAASSIEKIENKDFNIKSNSPSRFIGDHTIVNYQKNEKGPLYFAVTPTTSNITSNVQALYMIIPHILSQKQIIPHEVFGAPAEGQITSEVSFIYEESSQQYVSYVNISFGTIECANDCIDSIYKPQQYSYFIHITNKDNFMQYFAKCNMETSALKNLGFNDTDIFYTRRYRNIKGSQQPNSITEVFSRLPNGTYYAEVMGVVFLETNYTKKIQEPFTFIYPMKPFVVGSNADLPPSIITETEEKYIIPLFVMVPLGIALFILMSVCIYKQIKTFIIRRRYRLAMMMQDKNPDVEVADQEKEGNINDDDEKQNKKKIDKINFLN